MTNKVLTRTAEKIERAVADYRSIASSTADEAEMAVEYQRIREGLNYMRALVAHYESRFGITLPE